MCVFPLPSLRVGLVLCGFGFKTQIVPSFKTFYTLPKT
jgi:hypothetical protein